MIKIGLVGEDPNDTSAIKNLLLQKFIGQISFIPLIRNKRGFQLDNASTFKALVIEYSDKQPDYVIFIRDADAISSESEKIREKEKWFHRMLPAVNNKGIFLLNIYELEALILSDINTFNKLFHVSISYNKNPTFHKEPKEFLIGKTRQSQRTYTESECPAVFEQLNFDVICDKCTYFSKFYSTFKELISNLSIK